MKNKNLLKSIIIVAISIGLIFYFASYYSHQQKQKIVSLLTTEIAQQNEILVNTATLISKNSADKITKTVVSDCSSDHRKKFESLLDNLNTLDNTQLKEFEILFDTCADFFAKQQIMMTTRLDQEVRSYKKLIDILQTTDSSISVKKYNLPEWDELLPLEKDRSQLAQDLVDIQQAILFALLNGETIQSKSINDNLLKANEINQEADVKNKQAQRLYEILLKI